VLAAAKTGVQFPWESMRARDKVHVSLLDLTWETDRHYVSFMVSDGDNIRFWLTSLLHDPSFWANPRRSTLTTGWGGPLSALRQLSPATVAYITDSIPLTFDLTAFANGYFYPDEMGRKRPEARALELHLDRMRYEAALWGVNATVSIQKTWDGPDAVRAYEQFGQRVERLLGMFVMAYAPYNAGQGKVLWIPQANGAHLPVVSCRYCIWANNERPLNGSPSQVAQYINAAAHQGAPGEAAYFDWVCLHAWSRFRDAGPNADPNAEDFPKDARRVENAQQGLDAMAMCARHLAAHVKVVKPEELLLRLRLALRTRETLQLYLDAAAKCLESLGNIDAALASGQDYQEAKNRLETARRRVAALPAGEKPVRPMGADARPQALTATQDAWRAVGQLRLAKLRGEHKKNAPAVSLPPLADPFFYTLDEALELTRTPGA